MSFQSSFAGKDLSSFLSVASSPEQRPEELSSGVAILGRDSFELVSGVSSIFPIVVASLLKEELLDVVSGVVS